MYTIVGKEIRVCVFFKEFKEGTHSKYELLKVESVLDVISDYSDGWSHYKLLMINGMKINYFSSTGLIEYK